MPLLRSSAISRAEYNSGSRTLTIWFVESGGPYDFYGVPESVYNGLLRAPSAGTYYNAFIRDHFRSNR